MNRTQGAGFAGIGICIIILLIIFAPVVLAIIAGCIIGAFLVYAILLSAPTTYRDKDQEITEGGILFVYYDV